MIKVSTNKSLRYMAIVFSLFIFIQVLFGFYIFLINSNNAGILLSISALSTLIAVLPFIMGIKDFDLFSPLALFAVSLTLGSMLRVAYVYRYQEFNPRANFLLFGSSYDELVVSSFYVFLGVLSFVIGYLINNKRIKIRSLSKFSQSYISEKRLFFVALLFGLFGSFMGILFLSKSGIDLSSGIAAASGKVSILYEGVDGSVSIGSGVERFLSKFVEYPFVILCSLLVIKKLRNKLTAFILCGLLAIPVVLIPFLYSSRSTVVVTFITIIIFCYYFGKIRVSQLVGAALAVVFVVTLMGEIRYENKTNLAQERNVLDSFIGSGNGVDFIRTAGIIDRVSESSSYFYGESYSYVLAILIPRAIWNAKPEIGLGPFIKSEIFGGRVVDKNGWPSGMIGEAYLNFGFIGLILVMLIYGWLAALIYNTFRPYLGVSVNVTLVYAFIAWRFGFGMPGLNFAHGLSQVMVIFIPSFSFLYLVTKTKKNKYRPVL